MADVLEGSDKGKDVSRRGFVAMVGAMGLAAAAGGVVANALISPDEVYAMPVSNGYILVDTKKCSGCESCMAFCSMAHEGFVNYSLSRIQVKKNALGRYPTAIGQSQCRQCPYPSCAEACPVHAIYAEEGTGVRMVDEDKCIGCERCIEACPFTPSRMQWNFVRKNAQKCDLCANTPYWNEEGGAQGKQACVEICPMNAIAFTSEVPAQNDRGYDVNMRNAHFAYIGYPIDDDGKQPAYETGHASLPYG